MTHAPNLWYCDHIHIYVRDRNAAEKWYRDVLGLRRLKDYEFWAEQDGGPLMIGHSNDSIKLALFQSELSSPKSTVAFRVDGAGFLAWRYRLESLLPNHPTIEDHAVSWSLYFSDPDANTFEITTYDYHSVKVETLRATK